MRFRSKHATSSRVLYFVFKWYRYENRTPTLRPELGSMCVRVWRREIQRVEVIDDRYWVPATLFGKIILLVCHDNPIYCNSCNSIANRQILAHAAKTMKTLVQGLK